MEREREKQQPGIVSHIAKRSSLKTATLFPWFSLAGKKEKKKKKKMLWLLQPHLRPTLTSTRTTYGVHSSTRLNRQVMTLQAIAIYEGSEPKTSGRWASLCRALLLVNFAFIGNVKMWFQFCCKATV